MVSSEFFSDNPSGRAIVLGSTQPLTEMSTRNISWLVKGDGAYGWQPYHHPVTLSWNLGTLTSWNPLGHSRPVTGLLYLSLPSFLTNSARILPAYSLPTGYYSQDNPRVLTFIINKVSANPASEALTNISTIPVRSFTNRWSFYTVAVKI